MAKALERDSQIILNVLQLQQQMQDIIDGFDSYEEVAKDTKSFDLLYFYTLKIINLSKNFHSKTKKDGITFFDEFLNKLLVSDLSVCYPTLSKVDLVKYFAKVSDYNSMHDLKQWYEFTITKSSNYQGETKK